MIALVNLCNEESITSVLGIYDTDRGIVNVDLKFVSKKGFIFI